MAEMNRAFEAGQGESVVRLKTYPWESVLLRLQSVAQQAPIGACVVSVQIMLYDGRPVQWFKPEMRPLEPKRSALDFLACVEGGDVE